MHNIRGRLICATVTVVLSWTSADVATQSNAAIESQTLLMAPHSRVRGATPRIVSVLMDGAARSETFRGLIATIEASDGRVYIAEGRCGQLVRACFLHTVTIAGATRLLRIVVDPRYANADLIASVGHELHHVVEVLSNRSLRSAGAIRLFYRSMCRLCLGWQDTEAAKRAGDAVRKELARGERISPSGATVCE
jgi:hypothetical protein